MRLIIEKALAAVLVFLFVITVMTVTWQVIGRYVLAAPSSATEEVARFLLIWLGTLSAAYAFARRMHVGVDLISARMSEGSRVMVARFIWFICAVFALGVMVYGGGQLVNITRTLGQTSAAMGLPMWTIYTVMPISGLIIAYFAISFLISGTPSDHAPTEEPANE
ncbi:TRAP transporter small permease [Aurantiacibacter marinus]|uniref:TRAP transporter small permease protein n=1 Tax=Aurantiacibacter marinus TaxID=874156 RepID=A0A0H0XNC8_9SPHN|nr:TRAP transporter small permease [Aurantiacibacter marinus]KLI64118.1 hypothetical protein AAV99_00030 [Aurantiacibacter marinus]